MGHDQNFYTIKKLGKVRQSLFAVAMIGSLLTIWLSYIANTGSVMAYILSIIIAAYGSEKVDRPIQVLSYAVIFSILCFFAWTVFAGNFNWGR